MLAPSWGRCAGCGAPGAAALDLAWVAAGRFDGFWERNLPPWDMAAGIVILREAGGYVSDADGKERMLDTGSIVAGNETIHRKLLKLLEDAGGPSGKILVGHPRAPPGRTKFRLTADVSG